MLHEKKLTETERMCNNMFQCDKHVIQAARPVDILANISKTVLSFHRKTGKKKKYIYIYIYNNNLLNQFHMSDANHLVDEPLQVFEILWAVEQTVHYYHRLVSNHRSPETCTKKGEQQGRDPAAPCFPCCCPQTRVLHCFHE